MQIHELNGFNGNLNGEAYLAVDNGEDTGKVSASRLLADVKSDLSEAESTLNARIDNIIAGGTAPSAAEVTDGRLGAPELGSVSYSSLGDAIRGQVGELKNDMDLIGESNVEYKLASRSISGTAAWNAVYITTGIVPVYGETYYLHIDSVSNCMSEVCANVYLKVGSSNYSVITMTLTDVNAERSIPITINNASIDGILLVLYRNASDSTVASGTTTFTGVRITRHYEDVVAIANADFDLSQNEDFLAVASNIETAQYDVNRLNEIDTVNGGFVAEPMNWLRNRYAIYFDRDVYVKEINPNFTAQGEAVTYTIKTASTETIEEAATTTLDATITGTTGTPVVLNRILKKNQLIEISCQNAYMNFCETRYVRRCYPYTPKFCYVQEAGTISSVASWSHMRASGVFNVYETNEFWDEFTNYWFGKRIVWFGTSIPEGGYEGDKRTAYPALIGDRIGAAIFNESVGSSSISRTHPDFIANNNPYGFDTPDFEFAARCLGDSLALKQWLIDNYNAGYFTINVPSSMTDSLKNTIRGYSYENKVDRYLSGGDVGDVDLYVFDQGYNDDFVGGYRDVEALESQYGIDTGYCFDGGMNFLIRRILAKNPDAKIVIISHYTISAPCGNQVNAHHVAAVCEAQKKVADRWGIKFINIYEKLGWSGQLIDTTGYWDSVTHEWVNSGGTLQQISVKNMHVRDKTHPFTDASGKSNIRIADVIAAEIENIIR